MEAKAFGELVDSVKEGGKILDALWLAKWKAHCEREWRKLKAEAE